MVKRQTEIVSLVSEALSSKPSEIQIAFRDPVPLPRRQYNAQTQSGGWLDWLCFSFLAVAADNKEGEGGKMVAAYGDYHEPEP